MVLRRKTKQQFKGMFWTSSENKKNRKWRENKESETEVPANLNGTNFSGMLTLRYISLTRGKKSIWAPVRHVTL